MDQLADTGVRFTQAYAHTVCCPARAMLMTGRYPQRGNVNMWTQCNAKELIGKNRRGQSLGNLKDPQPEMKNYIKQKTDIAKRLQKLHNEWLQEVKPEH